MINVYENESGEMAFAVGSVAWRADGRSVVPVARNGWELVEEDLTVDRLPAEVIAQLSPVVVEKISERISAKHAADRRAAEIEAQQKAVKAQKDAEYRAWYNSPEQVKARADLDRYILESLLKLARLGMGR